MLRWAAHAVMLSAAVVAIGVGTGRVDAGRTSPNAEAAAPEPPQLQAVDQAQPVQENAAEPAFPERVERWRSLSVHASNVVYRTTRISIDHNLLLALIAVESSGDPGAHSSVGAVGLAQVEPSTFTDLQARYRDVLGGGRLEEPSTNLLAGALYLADCARLLHADLADPSGLNLVLDAYNLGPRAAATWRATGTWLDRDTVEHSLPDETVQHAERVIAAYQRAQGNLADAPDVDQM